jgi:GntR family transcriptional regulator
MSIIAIDTRDPMPIYAQLERGLRRPSRRVACVRDRLPTVRQLAIDLRVTANTVARVYAALERAEVIETRRGVGSFIRATPARAHPPHERERRLRSFITRVLADADAAGFSIGDVVAALRASSLVPSCVHKLNTGGRAQPRPCDSEATASLPRSSRPARGQSSAQHECHSATDNESQSAFI